MKPYYGGDGGNDHTWFELAWHLDWEVIPAKPTFYQFPNHDRDSSPSETRLYANYYRLSIK